MTWEMFFFYNSAKKDKVNNSENVQQTDAYENITSE